MTQNTKPVLRFAPSPTGYLHIGGARTALFNWLYARHTGGKFLLRIEDTDRERSTQPAIKAILDGLNWLELDWDSEPIYQAARAQRHREVAAQLLADGKAYRCYASPEELSEMREAAKKAGRSKLYDGRWRDRDPPEAPPGVKPLIHGPDGAKLSKRHGALGIEAYRAMGFLPAGLRNYLVRLGWSHGDAEIFSTEQAIAWFDIDDINKSPGRLDFAKLGDVNSHYIRQASSDELIQRIRELLPELPDGADIAAKIEKASWDRLAKALPSLKERAKTLNDLVAGAGYLLATRPLALDEKAAKLLDAEGRASLAELLSQLEAAPDWQTSALEALVRTHAERTGAKLGKVAQPLRAALTGSSVSPPVFDVMAVLGREEALARIRDQAR